MRDGHRLIANIGSLLDASAADRERLAAAGAVVAEGRGGTEDDLVASCADAEIMMGLGQFPFTERVFEGLPRLEFLMQCTVGYDRVDVGAATRHGVLVANSPLFCIEEVSDHAVMLLMACARKLPHQVTRHRRHGWSRPPAVEAMGSVAARARADARLRGLREDRRLTAEKLAGFRMRYLAHDPYLTAEAVRPWGVELVSLDELCRRADFISMHALLNAETRGDVRRGAVPGHEADGATSSTPPAAGPSTRPR